MDTQKPKAQIEMRTLPRSQPTCPMPSASRDVMPAIPATPRPMTGPFAAIPGATAAATNARRVRAVYDLIERNGGAPASRNLPRSLRDGRDR